MKILGRFTQFLAEIADYTGGQIFCHYVQAYLSHAMHSLIFLSQRFGLFTSAIF